MKPTPSATPTPATGQEIKKILGPTDDETVTEILRTGATAAEVRQALEWLDDDDYMGGDLEKKIGERVRRVYEILQKDQERFESREH